LLITLGHAVVFCPMQLDLARSKLL